MEGMKEEEEEKAVSQRIYQTALSIAETGLVPELPDKEQVLTAMDEIGDIEKILRISVDYEEEEIIDQEKFDELLEEHNSKCKP